MCKDLVKRFKTDRKADGDYIIHKIITNNLIFKCEYK